MSTATPEVIGRDLNETIATAIQARVEAAVAAELSSSDLFSQFVQAALLEPMTVRENYKDRKTTYLQETIRTAIKESAKSAVVKFIDGEQEQLEKLVAAELRKKTKEFAGNIVGSVLERAKSGYSINVDLKYQNDY